MDCQGVDGLVAAEGGLRESSELLAKSGIVGEISRTPGHSDDSVTLVLDSGDAFTGDLQSVSRADENAIEAVTASWARIRALNVNKIHPGHGPSLPMPKA